ncbi:MAG: hypothetical protein RIE77_11705 [Phycisphaerales bacterium]|jgi:hypothetical protein
MKNIIATPCTTACSLGIATRWALGGLILASAILTLLVATA